MPNGFSRPPPLAALSPAREPREPILFTLTPGRDGQGLSLAPLPPGSSQAQTALNGQGSPQSRRGSADPAGIDADAVADLVFDEARVLVCTTFVGEASPDMAYYKHWIKNTPPLASKIAVEGLFLGPPTMLLITMPQSVWAIVQHDKVCFYLGWVGSHNMLHLYNRLTGVSSLNTATAKDVEDGRILLEARAAASSGPPKHRRSLPSNPIPNPLPRYPEALVELPRLQQPPPRQPLPARPTGPPPEPPAAVAVAVAAAGDVEDSAEMKEAAEQLKALSHMTNTTPPAPDHAPAPPAGGDGSSPEEKPDDTPSSSQADDSVLDKSPGLRSGYATPTSRGKRRRSFHSNKTPKQETRCDLCSHQPFKDSSSLRKHVAAAHTRPFPCAFSFAGCTSTFGSKNEWKRHISSQHLCLDYWKCSECPPSSSDPKSNEFNRKDLFTQHLRRMHAPFQIKKNLSKADSPMSTEWEARIKDLQRTCHIINRTPPQKSACPKPNCQSSFEGLNSWDEWTEHVGRHLEKSEGQHLGVDPLLATWAVEVNIIERADGGGYKLCGQQATREKDQNYPFVSETAMAEGQSQPVQDGPDQSTVTMATAAAATAAAAAAARLQEMNDKMDVDG